jgi:hypothetical protein
VKIEKEDFEQWQAHPVTEEVARALRSLAEQAKLKWIEASWEGGNTDPLLLADLRARHQITSDLSELTYEQLERELYDESDKQ